MGYAAENLADLVTTTLRDLGRFKWTDISFDLQKYHALPSLLKKKRVPIESGVQIQWNVQVSDSGQAEHVKLFQVLGVNVEDVMVTANVPWRHTNTKYAIEDRERAMNRDPARVVDLTVVRRHDAHVSLAKLMETCLWSCPDSGDDITPYGLLYWIVKHASLGFYGGNHANFSSGPGNLSATTYAAWRNHTGTYSLGVYDTSVFVRRIRQLMTYTHFESPVPDHPKYARADQNVIYTTYAPLAGLEEIAVAQNDQMGRDVASMDGKVLIRGTPVRWVPQLEVDTSGPLYFVNWGVLDIVFLRGEYMNEQPPMRSTEQPRTVKVHIDNTWNTRCYDRRRLGVLYGA